MNKDEGEVRGLGVATQWDAWQEGLDEDIFRYFTEGQCHALATYLNNQYGWPIILLSDVTEQEYGGDEGSVAMCHALVELPDGYWLDIVGPREPQEVQDEWAFCEYAFSVTVEAFDLWESMDYDTAEQWGEELVQHFNLSHLTQETAPVRVAV